MINMYNHDQLNIIGKRNPSTTISSNNCLTTPFPLHNDHNHLPLCRLVSSLDGAGGRPTRRPRRRKGTAEQQQQQQQSAADRRVVILSSAPNPQRRGADPFHLRNLWTCVCAKKLEIEELLTWST